MRKRFYFTLVVLMIFTLCGCGRNAEGEKGKKWDCSVLNPEEGETVIAYSDVEMQTDSTRISFQNRNDFPVHFYLCSDDAKESLILESDIPVGGFTSYEQVNRNYKYTVGFHADVEEGTTINIMAYDGDAMMEPYQMAVH